MELIVNFGVELGPQSLVAVEPATLIVTICNLFLQIFIVKKFLLDKVMEILDARRKAADEQIVEAQAARDEAMLTGEAPKPRLTAEERDKYCVGGDDLVIVRKA